MMVAQVVPSIPEVICAQADDPAPYSQGIAPWSSRCLLDARVHGVPPVQPCAGGTTKSTGKRSTDARRKVRGRPPASHRRRDFPRPCRPFRTRSGSGDPRARPRRLRPDAGFHSGQSRARRRATPHRHRQHHGHVCKGLYRSAVSHRGHPARPRAHGGDGALPRCASRGLRGDRCGDGASASDRCGISHAAIGADAAAGRHRRGAGDGGLYARAGPAGRNAGGPHSNSHSPDRSHGVAATLAFASERRSCAHQHHGRGRRCRGGNPALRAFHRSRSDPITNSGR